MAHACNLSTWETETGESQVQGQPGSMARSCLKKVLQNRSLEFSSEVAYLTIKHLDPWFGSQCQNREKKINVVVGFQLVKYTSKYFQRGLVCGTVTEEKDLTN